MLTIPTNTHSLTRETLLDEHAQLHRLTGEQTSKYWDLIRATIYESHIPEAVADESMLSEVFSRLVAEEMDAWFSMTAVEEDGKKRMNLRGVIVTVIRNEPCGGTKHLQVYSVKGFGHLSMAAVSQAWDILKEYGLSKGCQRLVSATSKDNNASIHRKLGGVRACEVYTWEL